MPLYLSIDDYDADGSCTSIMVEWLVTSSNVTCGCFVAIAKLTKNTLHKHLHHCWCVMCTFLDCNNNILRFFCHSPPMIIFVSLIKIWFFFQLGCAHTSHCQKCKFCSSMTSYLIIFGKVSFQNLLKWMIEWWGNWMCWQLMPINVVGFSPQTPWILPSWTMFSSFVLQHHFGVGCTLEWIFSWFLDHCKRWQTFQISIYCPYHFTRF